MDGVGGEFVDEDVVVGCVANGAADDADGESEGRDGGDEILDILAVSSTGYFCSTVRDEPSNGAHRLALLWNMGTRAYMRLMGSTHRKGGRERTGERE